MNSLIILLSILCIVTTQASFLKQSVNTDDDVRHMKELFRTGWLRFLTTFHYNETYPLHDQWFGSKFENLLQEMKDTVLDPTIDYETKARKVLEIYEQFYMITSQFCDSESFVNKLNEVCSNSRCTINTVAIRILIKIYYFSELVIDFWYYMDSPARTHEVALEAVKHMGFDAAEIAHIVAGMPINS